MDFKVPVILSGIEVVLGEPGAGEEGQNPFAWIDNLDLEGASKTSLIHQLHEDFRDHEILGFGAAIIRVLSGAAPLLAAALSGVGLLGQMTKIS
jgi:hypothetical protein